MIKTNITIEIAFCAEDIYGYVINRNWLSDTLL